jgi:hypothetical protein
MVGKGKSAIVLRSIPFMCNLWRTAFRWRGGVELRVVVVACQIKGGSVRTLHK